MKNENYPLERKNEWASKETWDSISITDYVRYRMNFDWFNCDSVDSIEEQIERLVEVFANLMEKLYNTRTLNLKDIANIIGGMPSNVRKREVK